MATAAATRNGRSSWMNANIVAYDARSDFHWPGARGDSPVLLLDIYHAIDRVIEPLMLLMIEYDNAKAIPRRDILLASTPNKLLIAREAFRRIPVPSTF